MLKAGKIAYSVEIFKDLLCLKKEWKILDIRVEEFYKDKIFVGVSGDELPEVKENELIPEVIVTINKDKKIVEIRKV